jgi:hypothetical protein
MISRLAHHLPRGVYLRQLAHGLVFGKIGHALAVVAAPRTTEGTPTPTALKAVQVAVNNLARSVTGCRPSEHVRVEDLNKQAGFPLLNELITRSVALETWGPFTVMKVAPGTPFGSPCLSKPGTTGTQERHHQARCQTDRGARHSGLYRPRGLEFMPRPTIGNHKGGCKEGSGSICEGFTPLTRSAARRGHELSDREPGWWVT